MRLLVNHPQRPHLRVWNPEDGSFEDPPFSRVPNENVLRCIDRAGWIALALQDRIFGLAENRTAFRIGEWFGLTPGLDPACVWLSVLSGENGEGVIHPLVYQEYDGAKRKKLRHITFKNDASLIAELDGGFLIASADERAGTSLVDDRGQVLETVCEHPLMALDRTGSRLAVQDGHDISLLDLRTNALVSCPIADEGWWNSSSCRFSPDGAFLAVTRHYRAGTSSVSERLIIVDAVSGDTIGISDPFAHSLVSVVWATDSRDCFAVAPSENALVRFGVEPGDPAASRTVYGKRALPVPLMNLDIAMTTLVP